MKNTMRLQGIGMVQASQASEIKPGDKLVWNFGQISEVLSTSFKGKSIYLTVLSSSGKNYTRRMLLTRSVCIAGKDLKLI